jgi:hypothetical protein
MDEVGCMGHSVSMEEIKDLSRSSSGSFKRRDLVGVALVDWRISKYIFEKESRLSSLYACY